MNDFEVEIRKALTEYRDLTADELKKAVKKASKTVKSEIQAHAPRKTGTYAKSWIVTTEHEDSGSIALVVHSKEHYRRTHLLENGHALRNGGRARALPHIAPAREKGETQLESDLKNALKG